MSEVIKEALYDSAMKVFETSAFMDVFEYEEMTTICRNLISLQR